ncbi:MAG: hypothetical protein ACI9EW_002821 [Cellvibrionaceae bacterium]|jgi:uncharacterized protein (DUF924 family)
MSKTDERIEEILRFWFGDIKDGFTADDMGWLWWAGGEKIDENIRDRFGVLVVQAGNGELAGWTETAEGRLAHIILLDQFTRNIYRKSAEAFAHDSDALRLTLEGIEQGHDLELEPIQRVFMYMPLEHAEDVAMQELCMVKFRETLEPYVADETKNVKAYLDASVSHHAIVEQFGRFPHRNAVLGRESTPEEVAYLGGDHQSFGQ